MISIPFTMTLMGSCHNHIAYIRSAPPNMELLPSTSQGKEHDINASTSKGCKSLRPSPVPGNFTGIDRSWREKSIHKCFPVERLQVIATPLPNPNKITGIGSSKHGNSSHLCKSSRIYTEQCYILINILCSFHFHKSKNSYLLICVA